MSLVKNVHEDGVSIQHWQWKLGIWTFSIVAVDNDTASPHSKRIAKLLSVLGRTIDAKATREVN